jgi:hypothetical protein
MVFSVCPFCGEEMQGLPNMVDLAAWYARYHPDLPVGSVIPDICFDCAHEYAIGDCVVARNREDSTIYEISSLIRRENQPPLLTVNASDGRSRHFAVTQIRPNRVDESPTVNPSARVFLNCDLESTRNAMADNRVSATVSGDLPTLLTCRSAYGGLTKRRKCRPNGLQTQYSFCLQPSIRQANGWMALVKAFEVCH